MPRLFTYTIPYDDGAAPNPFHGMCTLAICKPKIRKAADVGDWVAGLGSTNDPNGNNFRNHLVYAMRVDEVITMSEYDLRARTRPAWAHRIPNLSSLALEDRLGDCIYDYSVSTASPRQRPGVHNDGNIARDLSGEHVLISYHYYYFGCWAKPLPPSLHAICHPTQGHKSNANADYIAPFVSWVESLVPTPGQHGWPALHLHWDTSSASKGCLARQQDPDGYCH